MQDNFNRAARVTHIALHVRDIEKSVAFYEQWCGMKEMQRRVSDRTGETVCWMACEGQEDDFVIVLLNGADPQQVDTGRERMRHLGFSLPRLSDISDLADRAAAAGILHWPYREFPPPVGTLCAVCDPDGHIVEFSHGQPLGPEFRAEKLKEAPSLPAPAPGGNAGAQG